MTTWLRRVTRSAQLHQVPPAGNWRHSGLPEPGRRSCPFSHASRRSPFQADHASHSPLLSPTKRSVVRHEPTDPRSRRNRAGRRGGHQLLTRALGSACSHLVLPVPLSRMVAPYARTAGSRTDRSAPPPHTGYQCGGEPAPQHSQDHRNPRQLSHRRGCAKTAASGDPQRWPSLAPDHEWTAAIGQLPYCSATTLRPQHAEASKQMNYGSPCTKNRTLPRRDRTLSPL